ncbi:MAG: hypothetical protein SGJ04_06085 [Bacteroidota bacterium]|nr:hypothetical protein [Bacteroidota bacterium]
MQKLKLIVTIAALVISTHSLYGQLQGDEFSNDTAEYITEDTTQLLEDVEIVEEQPIKDSTEYVEVNEPVEEFLPEQDLAEVDTSFEANGTISPNKGWSGVIVYSVQIESKNPTISSASLQRRYGNQMTLYINSNNYKMTFNSDIETEIIYHGDSAMYLVVNEERDSIPWRGKQKLSKKFVNTYKTSDMGMIMDHPCDAWCIATPGSTTTYLYDKKLRMNIRKYKSHGYDYFNWYVMYSRAPFLKCVYEGTQYRKVLTAIEIKEEQLPDEIFNPVRNLPLTEKEY